MPRVIHFELTAEDPQRAMKFYRDVFGWEIVDAGVEPDYWLASTGPAEEPGINGAIMPRDWPQGCINTIAVESLDDTLAKIAAAGGKQLNEKNEIPGIGQFAYCRDTEGVIFGLMEPSPNSRM